MHTTLAIETSCDDTSIALVQRDGDDFSVELMRAASSIADHQKYGGVVPEIASRRHSEDIIPLIESFGYDRIASVDSISVTTHPGLPGSLAVGRTMAQLLSQWFDIPHIPINHIHGHIFSILLERNLTDLPRPWMVLSVSGGHNDIYLVEEKDKRDEKGAKGTQGTQGAPDIVGDFTIARLGRTLDDASGEAFDKVARMLGGPYPGGPWIGQQAAAHTPRDDSPFRFPRVFLSKADHERNFSFSGLKGQAHRYIEDEKIKRHKNKGTKGKKGAELAQETQVAQDKKNTLSQHNLTLPPHIVQEIAYEFQEAVVEVLAKKLIKAGVAYDAKTLAIVGGVSANRRLWEYAQSYAQTKLGSDHLLVKPTQMAYCTDNAAMIGAVGLLVAT